MSSWEIAESEGDELNYSLGQAERRYALVFHADRAFATLFERQLEDSKELAHAQVLSRSTSRTCSLDGFSQSDATEVASAVFADATRRWGEADTSSS
jgi:hypothetical protein